MTEYLKGVQAQNEALQAESQAILADNIFQRSPTLSKLLAYLVRETIAGRADGLKSYTIAVDGLGRSVDFDASSDSSARVQMIRLRKALESHYSKNGPTDGLCLYMEPGSYVIRMGPPSVAYPALYRLQNDTAENANVPAPKMWARVPATGPRPYPLRQEKPAAGSRGTSIWKQRALAALAGGLLVAATGSVGYQLTQNAAPAYERPVVKIMPVAFDDDPEIAALAASLRDTYSYGLPRFKLARVRIEGTAVGADQSEEKYRLNSRIVAKGDGAATLLVSLVDTRSNTVVWTKSVDVSVDPAEAAPIFIPMLGEIIGPLGAVALHESVLMRSSTVGGYPCMLKYFDYIRSRRAALEPGLDQCLAEPVKEKAIAATMLGIRGMYETQRSSERTNFVSAVRRGLAFARQGVANDPSDPWANFAMARLSYAAGDCRSATVYTSRTIEANANSPIFLAALAAMAPACNYPNAEAILDQALLTQSPLYVRSRLYLVQAALQQNRLDMLSKIQQSAVPESDQQRR
ncbi:MAG: hypothetical protein ACK4ZE_12785, partial [Sphingorhabdus sp.]